MSKGLAGTSEFDQRSVELESSVREADDPLGIERRTTGAISRFVEQWPDQYAESIEGMIRGQRGSELRSGREQFGH